MHGRVLAVDDDLDILLFLRLVLEEEGLTVQTCQDGQEATDLLEREDWDLVLSDLHMPGVGGLAVLEAVQRISPDTLVVILTSDAQVGAAVQTLRAGAYHFLTKPVRIPQLLAVAESALETRRLRASSSIYQATQAVFSTLDARDLPQVLVEVALEVMNAAHALILTYAPEGYELRYRASTPQAFQDLLPITEYQRLARWASEQLEPLCLPEGLNLAAWPLVTRNLSYGVLVVRRLEGRRAFGSGDMERLSVLASQVSLALDNAALISDLQSQVRSLERARRRLTTAERLEGLARFATGVAHELQAPAAYLQTNLRELLEHLSAFQVVATALSEGRAADAQQAWESWGGDGALDDVADHARYALDGARRVAVLAGDLSRISRTRDDVSFDLGQAVSAALRVAGGLIRAPVEVDLQEVTLRGNPGQLSSALINLLLNADQALASKPDESIYLCSRVSEAEVVIEVKDRGLGIAREHLPRVTEPFFTTSSSPSSPGLGLSVVQEIVESHGGELRIRSALGQGTSVSMSLPLPEGVGGAGVLALGGEE